MKYKLICTDMDGTLFTSDRKVTDRTKKAIIEAERLGVKVLIASGRIYNFAVSYTDFSEGETVVISSNGGYVREKHSGKVLFKGPLETEAATKVQEALSKHVINYAFFSENTVFAERNSSFSTVYSEHNKAVPEEYKLTIKIIEDSSQWKNILQENSGNIFKCIVVEEDEQKLKRAREELDAIEGLEVSSSLASSIEINAKGISKGEAVGVVADYYNIRKEEIICIGDGENDITMLRAAGLGVAMKNAPEVVKEAADYVTDSNDDEGVAKVIEKFILGR